jgi:hypothetical protein
MKKHLTLRQKRQLDSICDLFESHRHQIDLTSFLFLVTTDVPRVELWIELMRIELEYLPLHLWRGRAETYLARFPEDRRYVERTLDDMISRSPQYLRSVREFSLRFQH